MKIITFSLFVFSFLAFGACPEIECYNPCTKSKVKLPGDKCSVTWVEKKHCFEAYTECEGSKKCLGALCYDYCTERYRYFKTGNTCADYFDPAKFCWSTWAKCE